MAYTVDDLNRILAAIASSELEVELEGKRVKYRSMDELLKAKALIENSLEADGTITSTRPRTTYASFSKG